MYEDEFEALDLLRRAYEVLPMPQKRVKREWQVYKVIIGTMMAVYSSKFSDFPVRSDIAVANPFRSLANTIINPSYRNGSIESIHGGSGYAYRFTHRRFTNRQIRTVVRFSAERLSGIMGALPFWNENMSYVTLWPQRLATLPFIMLYPYDWSMKEESSHITLNREWTL